MARRVASQPRPEDSREDLVELTAGDHLPILLVDDRSENLRTLEAVLAPLGLPLHTATSGEQALRLLLEREYALILLDVRMPGLDGLETARLIKGRARTRDIPIVFLTAARNELGDIICGYGVGAVDYLLKPFDAELLRSKVAVFAELEQSRRRLKRSEAFLRAAFEGAPIGKTLLDGNRRIVRANPSFARLVEQDVERLPGIDVAGICHPEDCDALAHALDRVAAADSGEPESGERPLLDIRLRSRTGADRWVGVVATSIEAAEPGDPLLLVQWVDLAARRRAERARAELLLEHSARTHAEAIAERLEQLQTLSEATESLSLQEVLRELALRLVDVFGAEVAEVRIEDRPEPLVVRAAGGRLLGEDGEPGPDAAGQWYEALLVIDHVTIGSLRLLIAPAGTFTAADRSLLEDAAERAALSIRRAQLHEDEHRIASTLQQGLIPKRLPEVPGSTLAAYYQAAGPGVEVGGDWYDAFALPGGRLGVVLGDVAGRGIQAASAMGHLRSVARAFALADEGTRLPGEVLTRLNRHQLALGENELFTLIYVIVDPATRTLTWANAGHLPPLLRHGAAGTSLLEGGNGLMGIKEVVYENLRHELGRRATLVLYTDGLVERRGESLDVGLARLARAAAAGPEDPQPLCEHLLGELLPGEQLHDDVTAVVVEIS